MTKDEWLANAHRPLKELISEGNVFHSNFTVEDMLVIALQASLVLSEAPALEKLVARQAVRDVMGELITWLAANEQTTAATAVTTSLYKKGNGSGDGAKTPTPNP